MEKIQYITTWKMDFVEIGVEALPVIRSLWEGDPESGLLTPVMGPAGSSEIEVKPGFITPFEGEVEKSFGMNYNPDLQRDEMCYGLVMSAPGISRSGFGCGICKGNKGHPYYRFYLLLEHRGIGRVADTSAKYWFRK